MTVLFLCEQSHCIEMLTIDKIYFFNLQLTPIHLNVSNSQSALPSCPVSTFLLEKVEKVFSSYYILFIPSFHPFTAV